MGFLMRSIKNLERLNYFIWKIEIRIQMLISMHLQIINKQVEDILRIVVSVGLDIM